jgi:hypothetical protein
MKKAAQLRRESYYGRLGVGKDATLPVITQAYRNLARQYHPDKRAVTAAVGELEITDAFSAIDEAYKELLAQFDILEGSYAWLPDGYNIEEHPNIKSILTLLIQNGVKMHLKYWDLIQEDPDGLSLFLQHAQNLELTRENAELFLRSYNQVLKSDWNAAIQRSGNLESGVEPHEFLDNEAKIIVDKIAPILKKMHMFEKHGIVLKKGESSQINSEILDVMVLLDHLKIPLDTMIVQELITQPQSVCSFLNSLASADCLDYVSLHLIYEYEGDLQNSWERVLENNNIEEQLLFCRTMVEAFDKRRGPLSPELARKLLDKINLWLSDDEYEYIKTCTDVVRTIELLMQSGIAITRANKHKILMGDTPLYLFLKAFSFNNELVESTVALVYHLYDSKIKNAWVALLEQNRNDIKNSLVQTTVREWIAILSQDPNAPLTVALVQPVMNRQSSSLSSDESNPSSLADSNIAREASDIPEYWNKFQDLLAKLMAIHEANRDNINLTASQQEQLSALYSGIRDKFEVFYANKTRDNFTVFLDNTTTAIQNVTHAFTDTPDPSWAESFLDLLGSIQKVLNDLFACFRPQPQTQTLFSPPSVAQVLKNLDLPTLAHQIQLISSEMEKGIRP